MTVAQTGSHVARGFLLYLKALYVAVILSILTLIFGSYVQLLKWYFQLSKKPFNKYLFHGVSSTWAKTFFCLNPDWKLRIIDHHLLPKKYDRNVLIFNHQSDMDIFAIYALGCQFRWMSKSSVFKIPIIGTAMRASGYISVDRKDKDSRRRAMQESETVLRTDSSMLLFPEGTRSPDGEIKDFKLGAFHLHAATRSPIQPILIFGTRDILPKGTYLPHPAVVRVKVLPKMNQHEDEDLQSFANRVRLIMLKEFEVLKAL